MCSLLYVVTSVVWIPLHLFKDSHVKIKWIVCVQQCRRAGGQKCYFTYGKRTSLPPEPAPGSPHPGPRAGGAGWHRGRQNAPGRGFLQSGHRLSPLTSNASVPGDDGEFCN